MDDRELIQRFFGDPIADPAAAHRARRALDDAIGGRRSRRRLGVAAAAIVLITAASLVWSTFRPQAAAARALGALAEIPTATFEPGPGQFLHRVSYTFSTRFGSMISETDEARMLVEASVDLWLSAGGAGASRTVIEAVSYPTAEDERSWAELDPPNLPVVGGVEIVEFGEGEGPFVPVDAIPTDVDALVQALRDGSIAVRGGEDAGAFGLIGDLLAQGNLPAQTRTALLQAAGELEGVRLLGDAQDAFGRRGEVFAVRSTNQETRLLFDPATGVLLERATYLPDPSGDWHLADWQAFISVELVDELPPLEDVE